MNVADRALEASHRQPPALSSLVPHGGAMYLLGELLHWDDHGLRCTATVRQPHPLASDGRLPSTALIEYAAQAMAAHGRLTSAPRSDGAAGGPRPGMLVGLRGTRLARRWVDAQRLVIAVERLSGDGSNVLYQFTVDDAGGDPLASGRAMVVLERAAEDGR